MSDEYTNAPPMKIGEERDIMGAQMRAVHFSRRELATCKHCPLRSEMTCEGVCGDDYLVRLVPVDMVPILFLEGVLS